MATSTGSTDPPLPSLADEPSTSSRGSDGSAGRTEPALLPVGTFVGRYQLTGSLGVGGMGVVYRARDSQLNREVALKLVAGAGDEAETHGKNRLLREAQALAQLSHPNVIAVFDVGRYDEGVFIAMELVAGQQLDQWLKQPRSWREVVRVFTQVGQGLAAAHAVGLVHRDVKPANIMIGDDGRVRVLDFGLARTAAGASASGGAVAGAAPVSLTTTSAPTRSGASLSTPIASPTTQAGRSSPGAAASASAAAASDSTAPSAPGTSVSDSSASGTSAPSASGAASASGVSRGLSESGSGRLLDAALTVAGSIVGTPPYMAPEQHRGEPCDARSDQFSFCVAFYQGLYGVRPFAGATYEELRANLLGGHRTAPPAGHEVPPFVHAVILRGLALDAVARWPSMDALIAALGRDPEVIRARRRRALAVAAAGVLGLGAALLLGRALHRSSVAGICDDGAARLAGVWDGTRRAEVDAAFRAAHVPYGDAAFRAVSAVFDAYAASWTALHRETCLATRVRGVQTAEAFDLRMACLEGRLRDWRARVDVLAHADKSTVEHAVAAAQSLARLDTCADDAALRAAVPLPADPAARRRLDELRGRMAVVRAAIEAGRFTEARRLSDPLVTDARAAAYRPVEAEALYTQALLDERTDRYADAARELKELTPVAEAARLDELAALGWIDQVFVTGVRQGRLAEARELARTAGAKIERLGEDDALRARLEAWLGTLEMNDGHTAAAHTHVTRALALRKKALRSDDPLIAETLRLLADVAVMESKPDEAIGYYKEALAQLDATLGPDHPTTAWVTSNLAAALRVKGQMLEALAAYDRARAIIERDSGSEDSLLATIAINVGMIDTELGRYDAARTQYDTALRVWTAALGAEHANLGSVHLMLGQLALRRHQLDEAQPELQRAYDIFAKAFGADHPSVAEALIGFGDLDMAAGTPQKALPVYKRAVAIQKKALGASYPDLAVPLTGEGLAELATGDAAHAGGVLEEALKLRLGTPGDPVELARTQFALARALRAGHGDPARQRSLAEAARKGYAGRSGQEAALAEVDAFLR